MILHTNPVAMGWLLDFENWGIIIFVGSRGNQRSLYPPPRLREWRANGVSFLSVICFPRITFLLLYFSTVLLSYFSTMFTVGMFTVGMFTVGFGIVCIKSPPHPPPHTHKHTTSPLWLRRVSRLGVIFSITFWKYFWHTFLNCDYLLDSMLAQFPLVRHHFFEHRFRIDFQLILQRI